ncbi:MAG: esterase family protein, partial [Planctomycetaceae bacterium]|nr:esterase family protein [Planctomycetaceae bacterium]
MKSLYCLAWVCFIFLSHSLQAADDYILGPDSYPQPGVPKGELTEHQWATSKVFPDTVRDYWVYVPAQYKKGTPACVMIFQDGWAYGNPKGQVRATNVFDNLIHSGEMPITIAIFINPGVVPAAKKGQRDRKNRSFEYDTLSGDYARFLI